jgi:hypothetical protein
MEEYCPWKDKMQETQVNVVAWEFIGNMRLPRRDRPDLFKVFLTNLADFL